MASGTKDMEHFENTTQERRSSEVVEVTVEKTIQHGSTYITSIFAESEQRAWIHSMKSEQTSLIDTDGKEIGEKNYKRVFYDFIVLGDDQIFTDSVNKSVHRISGDSITKVCSVAPLYPNGISHSRCGGLLVCLADSPSAEITSSSKGEIHHMDMAGQIQRKYYQDESNHTQLLTWPVEVAQNINSDLCVSDMLDKDERSRLVVVNEESKVKSIYTGQATLKGTFTVSGVVCDSYGRIILSDFFNNAVHMLNADGEFVQLILTTERGLGGPLSLSLYRDSLWIGCEKGIIKVCKLKGK